MSDAPDCYHTYLLRLWRVQSQGCWQWRASLESPSTGERSGFATLDELCNYLNSRLIHLEYQLDGELEQLPPLAASEVPAVPDEPPID